MRFEWQITPHMPMGLPSASKGVRFLLNFLPPVAESQQLLLLACGHPNCTSSCRLAEFASSSSASWCHDCGLVLGEGNMILVVKVRFRDPNVAS